MVGGGGRWWDTFLKPTDGILAGIHAIRDMIVDTGRDASRDNIANIIRLYAADDKYILGGVRRLYRRF